MSESSIELCYVEKLQPQSNGRRQKERTWYVAATRHAVLVSERILQQHSRWESFLCTFHSLQFTSKSFSALDYSDINHLPEKEFYRELNHLKKKQHELTHCKKKKDNKQKNCSRSSHHFDFSPSSHDLETKRNITERISFADDGNSISSWQMEFGSITCRKRDNWSRLSSATSRPRTSRTESSCRKQQQSQLSNVQDDYDFLNSLKNFRSKSISPTRSQIQDLKYQKALEDERKFYSDITYDKMQAVDHVVKRDPMKDIPITSRIPLFNKVMEDQAHK